MKEISLRLLWGIALLAAAAAIVAPLGGATSPSPVAAQQVSTGTPGRTETPTETPTPTATATPTGTATATATATPTPHAKKDPITDAWPKMTAAEHKAVQDLIAAGKKKEALDKLVEILKRYCCNFDTMADGKPVYDNTVTGEGETERKKGGKVLIGDAAFADSHLLYTTLKHEMVHSQQWQDPDGAKKRGSNGREKQAYQRELDNAANTGISKDQEKDVKERLKQY